MNKLFTLSTKTKKAPIVKATKDQKISRATVQKSIHYKNIFENGICEIEKGLYSIKVDFEDINYQIIKRDDQIEIFQKYCALLNSFDHNTHLQITVHCYTQKNEDIKENICIPHYDDEFTKYRDELNDVLIEKAKQGENSIERNKYLIVSFKAENLEKANIVKSRLELSIVKHFKDLESRAVVCSGKDRINDLRRFFETDIKSRFEWDYSQIGISGTTSKDFISPDRFNFKPNNYFTFTNSGKEKYCSTLYLKNLPRDLNDKVIADLSDLPINMTITLHIDPVEPTNAFDLVNSQIAKMDMEKSNIMDKNLNNQRPVENIPLKLKLNIEQVLEVNNALLNDDQRMFKVSLFIYSSATTQEDLDDNLTQIIDTARKNNVEISYLSEQQEDAFNSVLPIGKNHIDIKRTLLTKDTAILIPFTSQELLQKTGVYYGINATSNRILMVDRSLLANPNGFFLGVPGSGKSFAAKLELFLNFLKFPNDEIIVIDPEGEYGTLAIALGGQVIKVSTNSKTLINPMDINDNYGGNDSDPVSAKSEFILTLFELLIGGRNGLLPNARSVIDRSVILTYEKHKKPTLKDLHTTIIAQPEEIAQGIALSLEMYIKGSLSIFSNHTNVDINNRLIVYDTKELGTQLKTMGLLITQDQVWTRIAANKNKGVRTRFYIDEVHLALANRFSAEFCDDVWKRARKYGGIPSGITQNVRGLLDNPKSAQMLSNCEFLCLMNQASDDRAAVAKMLDLSQAQLKYITNSSEGEGIIRAGKSIVPFINQFPSDTELYKLITTKFADIAEIDIAEITNIITS